MNENVILDLFAVMPLLTAYLLYLFFGKRKQHHNMSAVKLVIGNSLVFLLVSSVVLLSGEVYYRFLYDTTDGFGLAKTTKRWFQRHFHVNRFGYRDSIEYRSQKPDGKHRLTFLGDSITVGHGIPDVENRFANKMRAIRGGDEVHVLARCGWNTSDHYQVLRTRAGKNYEFDVVVLIYCINDLGELNPTWKQTLRELEVEAGRGFLVRHSYFLSLLRCRIKALSDPDLAEYRRFIRDNYEGPVWESQKQRLRKLRDEVQARGARLLVVTFPFLDSLGPDYEYEHAHARLAAFWQEIDVPHLDLLDTYRSYEPNELIVNRHDAHPNELAHALAAEAIDTFVDTALGEATRPNRPVAP